MEAVAAEKVNQLALIEEEEHRHLAMLLLLS